MPKELIASLKLIAPTSITPQPSPLEFSVGSGGSGAGKYVVVQMATVHGPLFFILSCDAARAMAKQLEAAAGSIIVVPAGAI